MKNYKTLFFNYCLNLSTIKLIIYTLGINFFLSAFAVIIFQYLLEIESNANKEIKDQFFLKGNESIYFFSILIGPLIETLLFQKIPLFLFRKLFVFFKIKRKYCIYIFSTSLFFGLSHYYDYEYIFATFLSGIVFAQVYLISLRKRKSGFWIVSIVHILNNFIVLSFAYLSRV